MKQQIIIGISILILLVLTVAVFLAFSGAEESKIKSEIEEANYCDIDLDCVDAGGKCPFGCYNYVNKNEVDRISKLINSYDSECVYGCLSCSSAVCENNKCKPVCDDSRKLQDTNNQKSQNESKDKASQGEVVAKLQTPIKNTSERVTKKPFGIFVTPQNSPVEEERFRGYHTGVDFEVFKDELDENVSVSAICSGGLVQKSYVSGYGGVAVQMCEIENQKATVIYGHLDLQSINLEVSENLQAGEEVGVLGNDKSRETDGERKHLHLGIHKGENIDVRGYVDSENRLSGWLDPCDYICD